jgi:Icc-related predicted phosphoesterase
MAIAAQCVVMKILAVSDQEVERLYDLVPQGHFSGVGLIIGCGDLRYEYLEYMVTILNVDLFYVPGNHDHEYNPGSAAARAAGCTNLDLGTARAGGLLLAGFGGSVRYRPDGANQYTQTEAFLRAAMLLPKLWRNRLRYGRALDVLVTHSPPYGVHDDESRAHRGLKAINWLLDYARPRYHLHGHLHYLQGNLVRDAVWQGTTSIVNVYPYRLIEIQDA